MTSKKKQAKQTRPETLHGNVPAATVAEPRPSESTVSHEPDAVPTLDAALWIRDPKQRADALVSLAGGLSVSELAIVLAAIAAIEDKAVSAAALAQIGRQLSSGACAEIASKAHDLADPETKASAFCALAEISQANQRVSMIDAALETIPEIKMELRRVEALWRIAPYLSPAQLDQAVEMAGALEELEDRALALQVLARIPSRRQVELRDGALAAAMMVKAPKLRIMALEGLAPELSAVQQAEALAEATRCAIQVQDFESSERLSHKLVATVSSLSAQVLDGDPKRSNIATDTEFELESLFLYPFRPRPLGHSELMRDDLTKLAARFVERISDGTRNNEPLIELITRASEAWLAGESLPEIGGARKRPKTAEQRRLARPGEGAKPKKGSRKAAAVLSLPEAPPRLWPPRAPGRPKPGWEEELFDFIREVYGPYIKAGLAGELRTYILAKDPTLYRAIANYEHRAGGRELPDDINLPTQRDLVRLRIEKVYEEGLEQLTHRERRSVVGKLRRSARTEPKP